MLWNFTTGKDENKMKTSKKAIIIAGLMSAAMLLGGCKAEEKTPVILAVSFGTSYDDNREATIGAVENAIKTANPDYEVRRAFTSQIVIDVVKERGTAVIDNVEEAFDKLVKDGVKKLVVQPTHVINGYEYDDLIAAVEQYKGKFDSVSVGAPLLSSDSDYTAVADIIVEDTAAFNTDGTAIVFMGHGTEHAANASYGKLQETLKAKGADNYFIGTVESSPTLDDVVAAVKAGGYKKVVLQPLMVVAGDHANNDMAGDEEDSWKSTFEAEGLEVECSLKGLGSIKAIQDIYVAHTAEAVKGLK